LPERFPALEYVDMRFEYAAMMGVEVGQRPVGRLSSSRPRRAWDVWGGNGCRKGCGRR